MLWKTPEGLRGPGAGGRGGGGERGHWALEFLWLFSPPHTCASSVSRLAPAVSCAPAHSLAKGGRTPCPVDVKEAKVRRLDRLRAGKSGQSKVSSKRVTLAWTG